jgi:hypothetical protein
VIDALEPHRVQLGEQELLAVSAQYASCDTCAFCFPEFLEYFR